jgi:ribosome-associated protein
VPEEVTIEGATIRLGQLLKLAGIVDSGSEVRPLLAASPALVNGEAETRRGRQLADGDLVRIGDRELRVRAEPPDAPLR